MSNSGTIALGTFLYLLAFFIVGIPVSLYARARTKDESQRKENFFLAWSFTLIATFCTWLMWICCFLHQMNPLVTPDIED